MFLTDSMNPTKQELAAKVAAEREAWEAAGNQVKVIPMGVGTQSTIPYSINKNGKAMANPQRVKVDEDEE